MQNCNIYIYTYKYYYTTPPVTAIGPDDPSGRVRIYLNAHNQPTRKHLHEFAHTRKNGYTSSQQEFRRKKMTSWCMYIIYKITIWRIWYYKYAVYIEHFRHKNAPVALTFRFDPNIHFKRAQLEMSSILLIKTN
jgi:hypothetical protein